MLKSLAKAALAALISTSHGAVIEMTDAKKVEEWFEGFDFSVVNFYDHSEESQKINEMFREANSIFES